MLSQTQDIRNQVWNKVLNKVLNNSSLHLYDPDGYVWRSVEEVFKKIEIEAKT